ncbi:DNA/RNA nuclease SfsA [Desulfopila aestuarii]|uniref:Sugar fermentation stimulation protein homolog n=1 Tax=Desulfopila aestuarii DSM 18488 TaxID=1121416 RepID=A0A1M7YHA3_9BACT|nr:DNA/RNA nuclease SfsA [Desulfopila aestuarii]SHO51983.1 sugar fermentation stimulation protein A [Desulfopila aestuarii DSM 18488]
MFFNPPLATATLVQRYKRFLVDVKLSDGQILTIHCPNTGSMRSCSTPGSLVAFSHSDNPGRKYPHTLEMVQDRDTWVGVNTSRTNSLVAEAVEMGRIPEFQYVDHIKREVTVAKGSRLDLAISRGEETTYVEVKNCSLVEKGIAMFPDAVTSRGTKHLHELMTLANNGHGACIFFLVQRLDAKSFAPAKHIDLLYSETLKEAAAKGVSVLAYQAEVSLTGIEVVKRLPCNLN